MKVWLALAVAAAWGQAAPREAVPDAVLTFHYVRTGMPVPDYTLTLHQNGAGSYHATYSALPDAASKYGPSTTVSPAAAPSVVSRDIVISPQTTARLFERVHSSDHLRTCESREKNIADSGAKTLSYTGADGSAQCTYNYTENKAVAYITETFEGIAQTLDEGRSIELKHRYDRLGLDQELAQFADAVKEGRAIEIATIAPVLQSLLDDTQVMERVRKRAAGLLVGAK